MDILTTGYTQTVHVELPTKAQLLLLRDIQLEYGNKDIAAAVDNVIDLLERRAARITETAENVEVISNPATNGSVRYVPEPEQVKAQADAVCEEYEEAFKIADKFNIDNIKEIPF